MLPHLAFASLVSAALLALLTRRGTHAAVLVVGDVYPKIDCPDLQGKVIQFDRQYTTTENTMYSIKPHYRLYIYPSSTCAPPGYTAEPDKCSRLPGNAPIHCIQGPK